MDKDGVKGKAKDIAGRVQRQAERPREEERGTEDEEAA
jgi:hypothetical protein